MFVRLSGNGSLNQAKCIHNHLEYSFRGIAYTSRTLDGILTYSATIDFYDTHRRVQLCESRIRNQWISLNEKLENGEQQSNGCHLTCHVASQRPSLKI